MKKTSSLILTLSLSLLLGVVACDNSPNGERIPEDLTTLNIIDDDYRNFYEIYVGSFYDSNGDGVGDLKGVEQKLSYIKDLGYNGIWLMPIFTSPSYHKYDAEDYFEIDPDFGTMEDLKDLVEAAHEMGINIILDLMINHSSATNQLFIDAANDYAKYLANPSGYVKPSTLSNKDWYVFQEGASGGYTNITIDGKTFYYESNFSANMPEFDLDNEEVRDYFESIAHYYLSEIGIDGFRLDAVLYYYYNQHERNQEYLTEFHDYCESINPDVYIVGEAWISTNYIKDYYANSSVESYFYFGANDVSGTIASSTGAGGSFLRSYFDLVVEDIPTNTMGPNNVPSIPAMFLDNHDTNRIAFSNMASTKFYYGLLAMLNGAVFTYYGDELGVTGAKSNGDPSLRCYMPWDEGEFTGKTNNPEGATTNYIYPSYEEQKDDANSIYNYYKKANLLRNQLPSIARGQITSVGENTNCFDIMSTPKSDEYYLTIEKTYGEEVICIIINFNINETLTYNYLEHGYNEVVGQLVVDANTYIGLKGEGNLSLPPQAIAIVRK